MKDGEQLGGPSAIGRPGDLVLENDEVVFVVGRIGAAAPASPRAAATSSTPPTRTRARTSSGRSSRTSGPSRGRASTTRSRPAPTPTAARGSRREARELGEAKLVVTTRYTLHAPDRALLSRRRSRTPATRRSSCPRSATRSSGAARRRSPRASRAASRAPSSGAYVGGVGRFGELRHHLDRGPRRRRQRQRRGRTRCSARTCSSPPHDRANCTPASSSSARGPTRRASSRSSTMAAGQPVGQVKLVVASSAAG